MNFENFCQHIQNLCTQHKNRDLETYLLAVMKNVIQEKNQTMTYELTLEILKNSFTSEPITFQKEWLKIDKTPDSNRMNKKFTNPQISASFDKTNHSNYLGFDFTLAVLKFQIAELHKMRGKQLENKFKYFGLRSETGHYWYNFDPFGNLECGVNCMIDNQENPTELDWSFIGELLENGRIYE